MMTILKLKRLLWLPIFVLVLSDVYAQTKLTKAEAENKLKQVQHKIVNLKSILAKAHHQHDALQDKIAHVVKLIQGTKAEQQAINQQAIALETEINTLQIKQVNSQEKIKSLENLLFDQLNLHVELTTEPPLQMVFGADNPFEYYQQLELYHYLFDSEQKALKSLNKERISLQMQTTGLQHKVTLLERIKQQLSAQELVYLKNKAIHHQALQHLSTSIDANTNELHTNEKNQVQLRQLLTILLKENRLQSNRPFTVMKKRLNYPVQTANIMAQKAQNGLIFKAPLGTKVHAVSPGRVVFADWLNGYGYLVIVDHGWGFMTLYANNQNLLKHKGENIAQGDVIATVGSSGAFHQQGLYFEIRQKARVVSAMDWFQRHA
ncbi:MAG: hypothetical protein EBY16_04585 [Gammaproteobacteria bacterium]|nr:hypothetical protein [Gammaproteobacteria bacterium]